jgi:TatD DNase family protein
MSDIIDSHAHLVWESFGEDLEQVIERAQQERVVQIVQAGVDFETIPQMAALSLRYPHIFFGVGLHPHEAKNWNSGSAGVLREAAGDPKNVAIGECGLDFHYNFSERQQQLSAFQEQVELARELGKPLIIHTRDAWEDTFAILHQAGKGDVRGVFHCFTGGPEVLPEIQKLDFYVSFSGILTFHNAKMIQAAAALVPANRIMVETDSPYLAPIPLRGKRNEPAKRAGQYLAYS